MFEIKRHSFADILEGMIIGGSIAAVTTFLFGTQKGKRLQKKLLGKVEKIRSTVKTRTARRKIKRAIKKAVSRKVQRVRKKVAIKVVGARTLRRRKAARR